QDDRAENGGAPRVDGPDGLPHPGRGRFAAASHHAPSRDHRRRPVGLGEPLDLLGIREADPRGPRPGRRALARAPRRAGRGDRPGRGGRADPGEPRGARRAGRARDRDDPPRAAQGLRLHAPPRAQRLGRVRHGDAGPDLPSPLRPARPELRADCRGAARARTRADRPGPGASFRAHRAALGAPRDARRPRAHRGRARARDRAGPGRRRGAARAGERATWTPVQTGTTERLAMVGALRAIAGSTATVQSGWVTVRVPREALRPAGGDGVRGRGEGAPSVRVSFRAKECAPSPRQISSELLLLGRTTDEARDAVEKYLDDAFLAGLPSVRLIHGKASGALRKAVRDLLAAHPLVDSFRDGEPAEGGAGATVA